MPSKPELTPPQFETVLTELCNLLTGEAAQQKFEKSSTFEFRVREILKDMVAGYGLTVDFEPHPYIFPDIVLGKFGIEVKFTTNDTWRSVANSVFESTRSADVEQIYVVFGKMGGQPAVSWGRYEDCVIHVRTSHVPRFEVEIAQQGRAARESLFKKFGISYVEFSKLSIHDRMEHVRAYARSRLKKGERLWWLEDRPDEGHSLPLQVRLFAHLKDEEKRQMRAEASLLCPQILQSGRSRSKYNDAIIYLLTYRGVLCSRDSFSAGSAAGPERGGDYVMRALGHIQQEMRTAAQDLPDALFVEYWGISVPPEERIKEWLKRADEYARTGNREIKPSDVLFREKT